MHVFSASSMNQTDIGWGLNMAISTETSTCGHLLSAVYVWPSPQWGLYVVISSVRPTCNHLLNYVSVWPLPHWGPCQAISPGTSRSGHPLSKAHTWPSSQQGQRCLYCALSHADHSLAPRAKALLVVGHSKHLAKFTARSKSASMHILWTYLKLCLKCHTWNCAELGSGWLCNIQSSICRLREKRLLRCLLGGGWRLRYPEAGY